MRKNEWLDRLSTRLTLLAILTALTTVLTVIISIPIPATQGYINLGDVGVLLAGLLLGPLGGIAGGVGSALADYLLGYHLYVPITFFVKGFEAAVTGSIFWMWKPVQHIKLRIALALLLGSVVMVMGYLGAETLIFGFFAAVIEVPGNIFQVAFGSIVGAIVFISIDRVFDLSLRNSKTQTPMNWISPKVMVINQIGTIVLFRGEDTGL